MSADAAFDSYLEQFGADVSDIGERSGQAEAQARAPLQFENLADLLARVDAAGAPQWLLKPIWPSDAYGVLAAEDKAGKTWMACDAAVAVSSGTPWLTAYPVEAGGPVLMLAGEGGERNLARRLRAVSAARDLDAADLPIRTCTRVPHLTNAEHLQLVADELAQQPRRFVILDPLYLAARGSSGSDLYAMGEALEGLQHVCQTAGAALLVVTHFNKSGEGRGAKRITGVGPGAWGRVLITANIESRNTTGDETSVVLGLDMVGGEIPDTTLRVRRRVWADDPEDLGSKLNYQIELIDDDGPDASAEVVGITPAARRVLALLTGEPQDKHQLGDLLAGQGRPLKARTIQDACAQLVDRHLADELPGGPRGSSAWILPSAA
jgi:hypothetical protein